MPKDILVSVSVCPPSTQQKWFSFFPEKIQQFCPLDPQNYLTSNQLLAVWRAWSVESLRVVVLSSSTTTCSYPLICHSLLPLLKPLQANVSSSNGFDPSFVCQWRWRLGGDWSRCYCFQFFSTFQFWLLPARIDVKMRVTYVPTVWFYRWPSENSLWWCVFVREFRLQISARPDSRRASGVKMVIGRNNWWFYPCSES